MHLKEVPGYQTEKNPLNGANVFFNREMKKLSTLNYPNDSKESSSMERLDM